MTHRLAALLLLVLPQVAGADPAPVTLRLTYDGYAAGFHVLSLTSDFSLGPDGYRVVMTGHTAGVAGFLYHANWRTLSEGAWSGSGIAPQFYDNAGTFGGNPRRVTLEFAQGSPVLRTLNPPGDGEHEPVPPGLTRHTIDVLSVTALVIRQVASTGGCAGQVTTFDGREVQALTLRSAGPEQLPVTARSSVRGMAVRCELFGHLLAGFYLDDPAHVQAAVAESIWLAPVLAGVPDLPVRMTATTHHLGRTTLYLTGATAISGSVTTRGP